MSFEEQLRQYPTEDWTLGSYALSNQGKSDAWLDGDRDQRLTGLTPPTPVYLVRQIGASAAAGKWSITSDGAGGYVFVSQHGSGANMYLDGHTASLDHDAYLSPATSAPFSGTHWSIVRVPCP